MIPGVRAKRPVADFMKVTSLAKVTIKDIDILVEELLAPHKPPSRRPDGGIAVYVFSLNGQCLKIGKTGPRS